LPDIVCRAQVGAALAVVVGSNVDKRAEADDAESVHIFEISRRLRGPLSP